MTEPVYHFVRGEGWVIKPAGKLFTFRDTDKQFYIEVRPPVLGEKFLWSGMERTETWWENHFISINYSSSDFDTFQAFLIGAKSYCVVVPL